MILAHPCEPFSDVARRINLVSRVICAVEWLHDGEDRHEVAGLLYDLEREIRVAIQQSDDVELAA